MLLLEVIANFRRAKVLKRLYKCGLLDVLRTWLSTEETPEAEALTDVVLTFLKEQWITKALISAYDFGIGKAIVKVKKSGSESNPSPRRGGPEAVDGHPERKGEECRSGVRPSSTSHAVVEGSDLTADLSRPLGGLPSLRCHCAQHA